MKKKELKPGDYVFVSRWSDGDPNDPWYVSILTEIVSMNNKTYYKVNGSNQLWSNCKKITKKRGEKILEEYPKREMSYNPENPPAQITEIFIHDITLPTPKNGNKDQERFVDRFNGVSELWKKSQDPSLSDEDRKGYSEAFWAAKYCLEQGIG